VRDRRRSLTRITRRGLELLDRAQESVRVAETKIAAHLTERESRELSRLCELLYGERP
jgi:DNA-binding MarR family transcriptional regulator